MERVIEAMSKEVAPKGSFIIQEGDRGDKFFVVEEGSVEFLKGSQVVGTVRVRGITSIVPLPRRCIRRGSAKV